jgi:hypothetical protein
MSNEIIHQEAHNYVVGMLTPNGIIKLTTGKVYSMEGALVRAKELNETCGEELKALRADKFVAVTVYD